MSLYSAPASRTQFPNRTALKTPRITVSTLRTSIIAEDEPEDDGQWATCRGESGDLPAIRIQPVLQKGSPQAAKKGVFESELAQSLDRQFQARRGGSGRGDLAKVAAMRRVHNRAQSLYIPIETPATPPLSPPVFNFTSLTSPVPFTSAISPTPTGSFTQGTQAALGHDAIAARRTHRRVASANPNLKSEVQSMPSLEEIRVLFQRRKGGDAVKDVKDEATEDASDEKDAGVKEQDSEPEKAVDEKTERRASRVGLQVLKRRSLGPQGQPPVRGPSPDRDESQAAEKPARPVLKIASTTPEIRVSTASPVQRYKPMLSATPAQAPRPVTMRASSGGFRSDAAQRMVNRLSLGHSSRLVAVS